MSIADDRIEDCEIGLLWAEQFTKIATDAGSRVIVLSLVYIIEGKVKVGERDGDWRDRVHNELRHYNISPDEFGKFKARRIGDNCCHESRIDDRIVQNVSH
jgi:hypothetical protein